MSLVDEIARLVSGIANQTMSPEQITVSGVAIRVRHEAFQILITALLGEPAEPRNDPVLQFIEETGSGPGSQSMKPPQGGNQ